MDSTTNQYRNLAQYKMCKFHFKCKKKKKALTHGDSPQIFFLT